MARGKTIEYVPRLGELVYEGRYTPKEILAVILREFPETTKSGVGTIISDLRNPKYTKFKDLIVVVGADGVMRVSEQTGWQAIVNFKNLIGETSNCE